MPPALRLDRAARGLVQGIKDLIEYLVSKGAKIDQMDTFGQTPLSISMSVLTKHIGARPLQIPRRYRGVAAQLLLKLGATPLDKSGVVIVLQRSGGHEPGAIADLPPAFRHQEAFAVLAARVSGEAATFARKSPMD